MNEWLQWLFVDQVAWLTSIVSLSCIWFMGDKRWWSPYIGIFGQIFWVMLALNTKQYGLLPAVVAYTVIYARTAYKWRPQSPRSE